MSDTDHFLLPQSDGLMLRQSHSYARKKLSALTHYVRIANTAMREKWKTRYYIDLFAGPGKNIIGNEIVLGSPLIGLTAPFPATNFIFNEKDRDCFNALQTRVSKNRLNSSIQLFNDDANSIVINLVEEIHQHDKKHGGSLNFAFIDPETTSMHWASMEKLCSIQRLDLMLFFPTMGIFRPAGKREFASIDRFFGTDEWRTIWNSVPRSIRRHHLIDFYIERLLSFGYRRFNITPDGELRVINARNSKNAEVYTIIYLSKHPLGEKFWKQASSNDSKQLPLF